MLVREIVVYWIYKVIVEGSVEVIDIQEVMKVYVRNGQIEVFCIVIGIKRKRLEWSKERVSLELIFLGQKRV